MTAQPQQWAEHGYPLFEHFKFGSDYTAMIVLAQLGRVTLHDFGLSGVAALHISLKLLFIVSNILTARGIYAISAARKRPDGAFLSVLWLISPAVIWVSAGHGQVESVACLCVVWAIAFLFTSRPFAAGIIVALGTGIEYFPLGVAAIAFILTLDKQMSWRAFVLFSAAFSCTFAILFAPIFLFGGGGSLISGVASNAGDASSVSSLSVWRWIPVFQGHLILAFAITFLLGSVFVLYTTRRAYGANSGSLIGLGIVLLLAVILDPVALPQFGEVLALGLMLIGLGSSISSLLQFVVPTLCVGSYFLYLDINMLWYDSYAYRGNVLLLHNMTSEPAASAIGLIVVIGTSSVVALYLLNRPPRSSPRSDLVALCGMLALDLAMGVWSLQPSYWFDVFNRSIWNLPAYTSFANRKPVAIVPSSASGRQWTLRGLKLYDTTFRAARNSSEYWLLVSESPLLSDQEAVDAVPADSTSVHFRLNMSKSKWEIDRLKVYVLLGSKAWKSSNDLVNVQIPASLDNDQFTLRPWEFSGPGWAKFSASIPIADAVRNHREMKLSIHDHNVVWNGSPRSRWIVGYADEGSVTLDVDDKAEQVEFSESSDQLGVLEIHDLPVELTERIEIPDEPLLQPRLEAAYFGFKASANENLESTSPSYGAGYLLVLIVSLVSAIFWPLKTGADEPLTEEGVSKSSGIYGVET